MSYPQIVHPSWYPCPCWKHAESIRSQLIQGTICPVNPQDIFRALRMDVSEVKIVLLSQDPYPTPENACGLTYAIPEGDWRINKYDKWPKSLQVIADGVADLCEDPEKVENYFDPTMRFWEDQGVLLLNSALTCNIGVPGSHRKLWNPFMTDLVRWLQEEEKGLIWYFHGGIAKEFSRLVFELAHYKFYSVHPANRNEQFDPKFKEIAGLYKRLHGSTLHWVLPF